MCACLSERFERENRLCGAVDFEEEEEEDYVQRSEDELTYDDVSNLIYLFFHLSLIILPQFLLPSFTFIILTQSLCLFLSLSLSLSLFFAIKINLSFILPSISLTFSFPHSEHTPKYMSVPWSVAK